MANLMDYRTPIKALITEQAQYVPSHGAITPLIVFDDEHQQYLLVSAGWDGTRRIHHVIVDVRIVDDKIWIEHDGTPPPGLAAALVDAGVPKQAIVLAFHHPNMRPMTEFAVA